MRYFSLSLSLLALLSFTLGCSNEEGAPFGETGTENPIVEDAGPPPNDQTPDASTASDDQIPPELPLVDPDCPSLRLMEFKSAELGPEGGKINLAFTELHLPKGFLNETTKITIARYGMSEKASLYDYYILLTESLKSEYRHFDIHVLTGYENSNTYPEDAVWGYILKDDFWRVSTQKWAPTGLFIGFFRSFDGKIGIRKNIRQNLELCPSDTTKKSSGTSLFEGTRAQPSIGKCFYAEYIQTTDDCEDFGAICHNGLAGNFLCETCFKRKNCDGTLRLDCCHICEIETISDINMKCTTEKIDSLSDIDCFIEEYTVNGDCKNINQGNRQFEKKIAETEVQCPALATTVVDRRIIDGQTCVTEKFVNFSGESKITLRYPRWENMPSSCSNAWSFFDCKLREHEREHYRIGMAHCENARIALQELSSSEHCSTDPSLAESAAYNDLQEQINQAKILLERVGIAQQDEFDQETNHGNVTLDCSCEQS